MDLLPRPIEDSLLRLQTRLLPMPNGEQRITTLTSLVWLGVDYLIDRGYFDVQQLVELANVEGWEPPNAPFEMRFTTAVVYWCEQADNRNDDYQGYCKGMY